MRGGYDGAIGAGPSSPAERGKEGRASRQARATDSVSRSRGVVSTDIYAAFAALGHSTRRYDNICAAGAVIEKESSFHGPTLAVPGLASHRAQGKWTGGESGAGIPKLALDAALCAIHVVRTQGRYRRSPSTRLKTEQQRLMRVLRVISSGACLSGKSLSWRIVIRCERGGPNAGFSNRDSPRRSLQRNPLPLSCRLATHFVLEVFSRRGGACTSALAHLLGLSPPPTRRQHSIGFRRLQAGAMRAATPRFQNAVTQASGHSADLDGDLLHYENGQPAREPGSTGARDSRAGAAHRTGQPGYPERPVARKRRRASNKRGSISAYLR
jgi:hypothetical protein